MQRHATQLSGGPRGSASGGPRGPATLRRQNEFTSAQARVKERTEQQRMLRRIHGIRRYDEFLFHRDSGHARAKRGHTPCDEARNSSQEHMWTEERAGSARLDPMRHPGEDCVEIRSRRSPLQNQGRTEVLQANQGRALRGAPRRGRWVAEVPPSISK